LAYLAQRHANLAVSDLENAARLGAARRAEGLLGLSLAHAAERQYKEAHTAYIAAVSVDPSVRSFRAGFAPPRGDADDYLTALGELSELRAPSGSDPYAFIVRGDGQHNAGQYDKAILDYTKAVQADGALTEGYIGRANCLFAQESYDAANRDFKRAIETNDSSAQARLRLATLLTARKDYPAALDEVLTTIKLDPKNSEAYLRGGNIRYFEGNYARALQNYELAAKQDPKSAAAYNAQGLAYFAMQQYPEAIDYFSRAIAINPAIDRYYKNRASAYAGLRDFANAAAELRVASLVNSDPAEAAEYQRLIQDAETRIAAATE
jgi:tetratricopeptide (TPR) repeat protein